jgi:N utilization substance protein A
MKGSRVQAIIRELRGEKIDIIEWSDEPSVFAANALSPAKVNQVRITDIENRQMEVIVNEDQLSLAIGKRGQNVRLATKLVGWNIDIRSEEEIKREVTEQMGALIASGEAVPLSAIEGVTAQQAEALAEHDINDIDKLATTSVDDLVEYLDLSLDEAEVILEQAKAVIAIRERSQQAAEASEESEPSTEAEHIHAVSVEAAEIDAEPAAEEEQAAGGDPTAAGYDEAVENGVPYSNEHEVLAQHSAEPVALTEIEPLTEDELILEGAGRDLRPDTITPSPDITSAGVAASEHVAELSEEFGEEAFSADENAAEEAEELSASADEPSPETVEGAAQDGKSDEKQDAS